MGDERTRGWYLTRIELAIGIVAIAIILIAGPALLSPQCFSCDDVPVLGVPSSLLLALIAVPLAAVGLAWMIGISRGPRDEPPPWRYRDR